MLLQNGKTLLMDAAGSLTCSFEMVKLLVVEHGMNVNEKDDEGATALFWASGCPYFSDDTLKAATLLISRGADVNLANRKGVTCLLELIGKVGFIEQEGLEANKTPAQIEKRKETDFLFAKSLLDAGARVDVSHPEQSTPLIVCACQYAKSVFSEPLMDLLLDKQQGVAWLTKANRKGLTPLMAAAIMARDIDLVKKLVQRGAKPTRKLKKILRQLGDDTSKEILEYLQSSDNSLALMEPNTPRRGGPTGMIYTLTSFLFGRRTPKTNLG